MVRLVASPAASARNNRHSAGSPTTAVHPAVHDDALSAPCDSSDNSHNSNSSNSSNSRATRATGTMLDLDLDRRPKSSSAHRPSSIDTRCALSCEPSAKTTPLSAVPALGLGIAVAVRTALTPSPSPTWGASNTTTTAADDFSAAISESHPDATAAALSPGSCTFPPISSGIITPGEHQLPSARLTPAPLMLRQPQPGTDDVSALGGTTTSSSSPRPDEEALSLDGMLSSSTAAAAGSMHGALPNPPLSAASLKLADALHSLARRRRSSATTTTALAALKSPCLYHQRFDDAVDIGKVLEEFTSGEPMSHSRLVQTATSVREVSKQLQRRPIKRAVRNVMIVTKARDTQLVYHTRELAGWLLRTPRYGAHVGVNVYVDAKLRRSRRFDAPSLVAENPAFADMLRYWTPDLCWSQPEMFDLVLTLGGDGTVLFTSWLFQRIVPPVLSFALGSLGFLTTFDFERYRQHLGRVMGDDGMKISMRMRFTCTVWRNETPSAAAGEVEQFEVLNEVAIDRGPSSYMTSLELYGDDELLTILEADGCIFSTPTGSTAYSLSAGGSLVHPDVPSIVLTAICPHSLSWRPMVLPDTMALRVAVPRECRTSAYCSFDGKARIELRKGDHVTITASRYPFPTVTRTDTEWFDSVSRTLRWNTRTAAQKPFEAGTDEEEWDIDTDSACYASEEGSVSTSPIRRQMSMLGPYNAAQV